MKNLHRYLLLQLGLLLACVPVQGQPAEFNQVQASKSTLVV